MVELDPRLHADCHIMGKFSQHVLLLMNNAHFPWLILVPDTDQKELHRLPEKLQQEIQQYTSQLAEFIETHFNTDKVNTAAIGNIVSQLHIHVVGRKQDDPCWPGVVWGCNHRTPYNEDEVKQIAGQLGQAFPTLEPCDAV